MGPGITVGLLLAGFAIGIAAAALFVAWWMRDFWP